MSSQHPAKCNFTSTQRLSGDTSPEVYLDWAATTPILPEAADALRDIAISYPGNPSSIHAWGRKAKEKLDVERAKLAELLNDHGAECNVSATNGIGHVAYAYAPSATIAPNEIIFTSGGSEANALVLTHFVQKKSALAVVRSSIEHPIVAKFDTAFYEAGHQVAEVPVDKHGHIHIEKLIASLTPKTALVTVMAVHNITGAIQPLEQVVAAVREYQKANGGRHIHIHCDAVQAFGKIPFHPKALGLDSAAFAAHKFQGPRGVGFLWYRSTKLLPLSVGGGQEFGMRPGTENLAGISAMVVAVKHTLLHMADHSKRLFGFRKLLADAVHDMGGVVISPMPAASDDDSAQDAAGDGAPSDNWAPPTGVPHILYIALPPIPSEVWLRMLSDKGIYISAGSACSASKRRKSKVSPLGLRARLETSTLRISMGAGTTEDDIAYFITILRELARQYIPHGVDSSGTKREKT